MSAGEFDELCIRTYGKPAHECKQIFDRPGGTASNVPCAAQYPVDAETGEVTRDVVHVQPNMRLTCGGDDERMAFQDQIFLINKNKMQKLISGLKDHNEADNIAKTQEEYDNIAADTTGVKKQISMYQIQRQMREYSLE